MFRKMAAAAALALVFTAGAQAQTGKIRVGVEGSYPPFSQIDTQGKLSGFDIDIGRSDGVL